MVVKICGITNREDAMVCAESGASAIGFNFYAKSPRYISARDAAEIARDLPAGLLKVGVFVDETPDNILRIRDKANLDIVQLHGDERPDPAFEGLRVWKAFPASVELSKAIAEWPAEAYLIDTPTITHGGSGKTFNWSRAHGLPGRLILAGGLDAGNVRAAIREVRPWGVDACSRLESAPGKKDHEKVRQFIAAAQSELL
ncbi:MAG: phosphoribosylanthranilate isomerase [Bryobacteraceae bacterium]|nr:phosphoribosylanthranilate isomerase [Bryobacteraceae bacterium]